ncbi:MAG: NAD(P)/FAD-dependent oxidoreductase [Magnetococcales bacterium]|nr:NAD(P)/FAD-dependent oxidoreductase [Magnetococcales bacterium]
MHNSFDAIVIGSGLGGLVAGALAAKSGARVVVLERHDQVGGAATNFTRGKLRIDAGLHQMDGFEADDPNRALFEHLGLFDHITLVPLPELYAVHHPAFGRFVMPSLADQHRGQVEAHFPSHSRAIHHWFDEILGKSAPQEPSSDPHRWSMAHYERSSISPWLEALFGEQEGIKLALCANLPYYGDDPDRLSLKFFATAQGSFYRGNYYIKGGSGQLSQALARIIRTHGGEVRCGQVVNRILIKKGRVTGVTCASRNGTSACEVSAPMVFANAAPMVTAEMLPPQERRLFRANYAGLEPATSLWCIYLGVKTQPQNYGLIHHSTFLFPDWMHTLGHYREAAGLLAESPQNIIPPYVVANYAAIDSGLATNGMNLIVLTGLDRLANWDILDKRAYAQKKKAWMKALIQDFSSRFPGIESKIVVSEMATARTMARYLNTPGGSVYGFAQTPMQAGRHRPGAKTPVPGLWLASAFSRPGGGFTGTMLAGHMAFSMAFRATNASGT